MSNIIRIRDSITKEFIEITTLKGDKGERGDKGDKPVKGIDYFTPDEVKQVATNVQTQIDSFITVTATSNTYTIHFSSKPSINVVFTVADTAAKTIKLTNVPTRSEMFLEVVYTNAATITWFSGITWQSGIAPTMIAGKTYRMVFFTSNGGTTWHGYSAGGV